MRRDLLERGLADGEIRERHTRDAQVTELNGLLRRPTPGAQGTMFEAEDGWRYSLWVTSLFRFTSARLAGKPGPR
jgi:hypothetical protein